MTANVQISKRLDDGTILVLAGATWDEFAATVATALDAESSEAILGSFGQLAPVSAMGAAIEAAAPLTAPDPGQHNWRGQAYNAPVRQPEQPAVAAPAPQAPPTVDQSGIPHCQHGAKQYRNGTGKTGKAWAAWMCPSPKGTPDQCEPDWR
ncbi:MAG: hypothetical protein M3Q75_12760 [Gemmatimonadota bacterium]|nr:hypothetical protein [Gemmatimonadota bacterium]